MKKIIHRSPTQVIYEDGTSKRFKRTPKTEKLAGEPIKIPVIETGINHLIPVRDEDVEAFREELGMHGALKYMEGYDDGAQEIKIWKVSTWTAKPDLKAIEKEIKRRYERNKWTKAIIISIVCGVVLGIVLSNL